ncbi:hypothetical protein D1872_270260 [compost metagenome]
MEKTNFKTWVDLRNKLNFKTKNEKLEITLKAKLTNAIVNKRKDRNIEIGELANLAIVEASKIVKMEENKCVPSFNLLMKLVVALDMEVKIS